jgi:hypothetical protein
VADVVDSKPDRNTQPSFSIQKRQKIDIAGHVKDATRSDSEFEEVNRQALLEFGDSDSESQVVDPYELRALRQARLKTARKTRLL